MNHDRIDTITELCPSESPVGVFDLYLSYKLCRLWVHNLVPSGFCGRQRAI